MAEDEQMKEIKELSVRQNLEAGALYLHLINHKEVQEAPEKTEEKTEVKSFDEI